MKRISKKTILELFIILVLGCTPILWFGKNVVILGHDSGLTISPIPHFFDRLFVWTERYGFGDDQTYALAGFFIHGLEAFIGTFHFSLQTTQKIFFIFWFMLPGLTMYYFASRMAKKFRFEYFTLPATIFYMFNHFLLQGWLIVERTKFSLYAALPLLMSFLFDWEEKKKSTLITAFLMASTLFLLNGEGSLPLFGGIIVSILVFVIFYLLKEFSFQSIRRLLVLFGFFFCFFGLLNSYWLLPTIWYVLKNYSQAVAQAGGEGGVLGWLDYISRYSSLVNLLRLQGVPEWYNNPFHPYANQFLTNPLLIFIGFMIPILAFIPLLLYKEKSERKTVLFYSFLAVFSLIFIAGSHPPFGAIYVLLFKFIPGFIAFRTPFYKFSPALWFSYAVLIGLTINYFITKKEKTHKIFSIIAYGGICLGIILYSYPFLTGSFFNYQLGTRSMKVHLPQYVIDFGKFSETPGRKEVKTLLLPPVSTSFRADVYSWGYWSLTSLTSLLSNASFISINGATSQQEQQLLGTLYRKMKNNDPSWVTLAHFLGIQSFLLRNDFVWNSKDTPTDNPLIYENVLNNSNIRLVKKFGQWSVYDFNNNSVHKQMRSAQRIGFLEGTVYDIADITTFPIFHLNEPMYVSSGGVGSNIDPYIDDIYLKPRCLACNLQAEPIDTKLYTPQFTKGSLFYFLNKKITLEKKLPGTNVSPLLSYYLNQSLRDILGLKKAIDEKNTPERIDLAARDYIQVLDNLSSELHRYTNTYHRELDNDFLMHSKNIEHAEEKIFLDSYVDFYKNVTSEDDLYHMYNTLQIIRNDIENNVWVTTDDIHKKLIVFSPKNQNFTLLYQKNETVDSSSTVKFALDGQDYIIKPNIAFSDWLSLGNFFLTKGNHKLEIEQHRLNLLASTSAQVVFSKDKPCFTTDLVQGYAGDVFTVSFRYRTIQGEAKKIFPKIQFETIKQNPLDVVTDSLSNSSYWNLYTNQYVSNNNEKFYLEICKFPEVDQSSEDSILEFENITITKITIPNLIFYSLTSAFLPPSTPVYEKKSPTTYVATLPDNNNVLLLDETYNTNWRLNGKESPSVLLNGYVNGWIISGKNRKVTITYKSQDFVIYGFIISLVSCVIVCVFFIIYKIKNYAK